MDMRRKFPVFSPEPCYIFEKNILEVFLDRRGGRESFHECRKKIQLQRVGARVRVKFSPEPFLLITPQEFSPLITFHRKFFLVRRQEKFQSFQKFLRNFCTLFLLGGIKNKVKKLIFLFSVQNILFLLI